MKSFFAWTPLVPPRGNSSVPPGRVMWADRGAFLLFGLGLLQVVFGFEDGSFQFLPLALGVILFGLPHGAIDHLVALGLAGRPLCPAPLSIVISLYLLLVFSVLGMWLFFPFAAAMGFLIMTIYHWGKGDLAFERYVLRSTPAFRGRIGDGIHVVLRGLIPIGLPFLAFPHEATEFVATCVRIFSADIEVSLDVWRKLVFVLFVFFLVSDCLIHLLHSRLLFARRIVIENFLLVIFFWLVPPLIAIGWYFAAWHGLRHILRLNGYEPEMPVTRSILRERFLRFAWQAFPFTLAAVLMLAGLLGGLADRIPGRFEGVALYLVFISALTLPHLLIVEWMDWRENRAA